MEISIITPTDGREELKKLIESLKKQKTRINHILIWGSGGSTLTPNLCNQFETESYKITHCIITRKPEKNIQNYMRSIGLTAACTNFVTFLDQTSYVDNGYFETVYEKFKNNADYVFSRRNIKFNGEILGTDTYCSLMKESANSYMDINCLCFVRDIIEGSNLQHILKKEIQADTVLSNALLQQKKGIELDIPYVTVEIPEEKVTYHKESLSVKLDTPNKIIEGHTGLKKIRLHQEISQKSGGVS